jgi:hypothetical protein
MALNSAGSATMIHSELFFGNSLMSSFPPIAELNGFTAASPSLPSALLAKGFHPPGLGDDVEAFQL